MSDTNFLIIDDDEVFSGILARGLRGAATRRIRRTTPDEAMKLANQQKFGQITVDLHLGNDSGLTLVAPLRDLQPDARILVLTGYASIATAVQAVKDGADNYLAKPANVETILSALQERGERADTPKKRSNIRRCCRSRGSSGSTFSACWPRTAATFPRRRAR